MQQELEELKSRVDSCKLGQRVLTQRVGQLQGEVRLLREEVQRLSELAAGRQAMTRRW